MPAGTESTSDTNEKTRLLSAARKERFREREQRVLEKAALQQEEHQQSRKKARREREKMFRDQARRSLDRAEEYQREARSTMALSQTTSGPAAATYAALSYSQTMHSVDAVGEAAYADFRADGMKEKRARCKANSQKAAVSGVMFLVLAISNIASDSPPSVFDWCLLGVSILGFGLCAYLGYSKEPASAYHTSSPAARV